jgi:hypothetical protein
VAGVDAAACVAKVDGPRVAKLREFAQTFGCAYQMLDHLRDSPMFSSATDGIIAEVEEACLLLEQHVKGGVRAEISAAELINAFLRSIFATAHHDRVGEKRSDS